MMNADVDGYTKTLNHRKIIWKTQKKTILKPKYKLGGDPLFTFNLTGGEVCPSAPCRLRHWLWYVVFTNSKLSLLICNKIRTG